MRSTKKLPLAGSSHRSAERIEIAEDRDDVVVNKTDLVTSWDARPVRPVSRGRHNAALAGDIRRLASGPMKKGLARAKPLNRLVETRRIELLTFALRSRRG